MICHFSEERKKERKKERKEERKKERKAKKERTLSRGLALRNSLRHQGVRAVAVASSQRAPSAFIRLTSAVSVSKWTRHEEQFRGVPNASALSRWSSPTLQAELIVLFSAHAHFVSRCKQHGGSWRSSETVSGIISYLHVSVIRSRLERDNISYYHHLYNRSDNYNDHRATDRGPDSHSTQHG